MDMEQFKGKVLLIKPGKSDLLYLSVSKWKTFESCKAKFKYVYIEKLPKKDWDFHIYGKFLHEILENFHKELIENPALAVNVLMTKCFAKSSENWKGKITVEQKKEVIETLIGYLELLSAEAKAGKSPTYLQAEKAFYIDIDGKILLNGFIDRIQIDPDGVLHVADYKTTKNKKYLKNDFFQLLIYAYTMCLEDPSLQKVRTSYILLRHKFEKIVKEFTRDEIMKVEDKLLGYAVNIEQEKLYRPNPTQLCNYCDHLAICEQGTAFVNNSNVNKFGESNW